MAMQCRRCPDRITEGEWAHIIGDVIVCDPCATGRVTVEPTRPVEQKGIVGAVNRLPFDRFQIKQFLYNSQPNIDRVWRVDAGYVMLKPGPDRSNIRVDRLARHLLAEGFVVEEKQTRRFRPTQAGYEWLEDNS